MGGLLRSGLLFLVAGLPRSSLFPRGTLAAQAQRPLGLGRKMLLAFCPAFGVLRLCGGASQTFLAGGVKSLPCFRGLCCLSRLWRVSLDWRGAGFLNFAL